MNALIAGSYMLYVVAHFILQGMIGKKRKTRPKMYDEPLVHWILFALGLAGLPLTGALVYNSNPTDYLWVRGIGALIMLSGLLLSMWALHCLGDNWIGGIGLHNKGHVLVQEGPYRVVRHPLYTGMMIGALGSGVVTLNVLYAFAAFALALAFASRAPREEVVLRRKFKKYDAYAARTGWFFPKLRRA